MNIRTYILLQGFTEIEAFGPSQQNWIEYFQAPQPIPTAHPPSLNKRAPLVKVETPNDVWKGKTTKKNRKKRKRDMRYIMRKTLNQSRPTMFKVTRGTDPNLWNPSQIADV